MDSFQQNILLKGPRAGSETGSDFSRKDEELVQSGYGFREHLEWKLQNGLLAIEFPSETA